MLGRIKETDLSVPYRHRGYYWYSRTEKGKQYPIYCRKKGSLEAPEEVVLDVNELAKTRAVRRAWGDVPSDDGNLLAYTIDTTGFAALHAPGQGPDDGQAPAGQGRAGRLRRLGGRRQDALLRRRRTRRSARTVSTGTRSGRTGARRRSSTRRRTSGSTSACRARATTGAILVQSASHTQSEWRLIPARDAGGGAEDRRAAREGPRVRRRGGGGPPLHPDERRRPQLPRRHGAGREPGEGAGRSSSPTATT